MVTLEEQLRHKEHSRLKLEAQILEGCKVLGRDVSEVMNGDQMDWLEVVALSAEAAERGEVHAPICLKWMQDLRAGRIGSPFMTGDIDDVKPGVRNMRQVGHLTVVK